MAKLVHNVQKKQHRERSQTLDRARFGLLEKKKDYKLRAADYHKKQAALKALRAKASNYNPDEYYHGMTRRKTDDRGILQAERGADVLSVDQVKLLKSQDANYVRTMRLNEALKIEKQKAGLDFGAGGTHTVFVDSVQEQTNFRPEVYFDTDATMLERRENRVRTLELELMDRVVNAGDLDMERLQEKKVKLFKLLKRRMEREKQLREVEERMETTRELMKKGSKKKTIVDGKPRYKWKNERKR